MYFQKIKNKYDLQVRKKYPHLMDAKSWLWTLTQILNDICLYKVKLSVF
jgi:hypothetical protein